MDNALLPVDFKTVPFNDCYARVCPKTGQIVSITIGGKPNREYCPPPGTGVPELPNVCEFLTKWFKEHRYCDGVALATVILKDYVKAACRKEAASKPDVDRHVMHEWAWGRQMLKNPVNGEVAHIPHWAVVKIIEEWYGHKGTGQ